MPRVEHIPVERISSEPPTYQPLTDALIGAMTGGEQPEERTIQASQLRMDAEFVSRDAVAIVARNWEEIRRTQEEFLHRVLVMERSDGSLWVYDDCPFVTVAQRLDPTMPLPCAVFRDPTR